MRKTLTLCLFTLFLGFGLAASVLAQAPAPERPVRTPEAKPEEKCDAAATKEESSVTEHSIRLGGPTVSFKATASTTLLSSVVSQSP